MCFSVLDERLQRRVERVGQVAEVRFPTRDKLLYFKGLELAQAFRQTERLQVRRQRLFLRAALRRTVLQHLIGTEGLAVEFTEFV